MMLWVFKRDPALQYAQGFVDVPDVLAERLIREGKAAAQYDQYLMPEPEQPGDGQAPAKPKKAPDQAAKDDAKEEDDDEPRKRGRRVRKS